MFRMESNTYLELFFEIFNKIDKYQKINNILNKIKMDNYKIFLNDLRIYFNDNSYNFFNITDKLITDIKKYDINNDNDKKFIKDSLIESASKIFDYLKHNCNNIVTKYDQNINLFNKIRFFIYFEDYQKYIDNNSYTIKQLNYCEKIIKHKINIYKNYIEDKKILKKKKINNTNKDQECSICYQKYNTLNDKEITILKIIKCKHEICECCFYKYIDSLYSHNDNYIYKLNTNPVCWICRELLSD